jgi:membrane-associated protein
VGLVWVKKVVIIYIIKTLLVQEKVSSQSKTFFEKHGGRAIIFAGVFFAIFRTFAPIVAGIVTMDKKKFMFYNIVSSSCGRLH